MKAMCFSFYNAVSALEVIHSKMTRKLGWSEKNCKKSLPEQLVPKQDYKNNFQHTKQEL